MSLIVNVNEEYTTTTVSYLPEIHIHWLTIY